jgi:hypothetical protein
MCGTILEDGQDNRRCYTTVTTSEDDIASLLLRLLDEHLVIFERIGLVHMWGFLLPGSRYVAFFAAFLADLDEETKLHLPCVRFEGGKHTIRIV